MKILSVLVFITLLASCTNTKVDTEAKVMDDKTSNEELNNQKAVDDTLDELLESVWDLDTMEKDETKVELIEYSYVNPLGPVNMEISYELDSEGKIASMSLVSNHEKHAGATFNERINATIIWLTLAEVADADMASGSSLTTAAFKAAIATKI